MSASDETPAPQQPPASGAHAAAGYPQPPYAGPVYAQPSGQYVPPSYAPYAPPPTAPRPARSGHTWVWWLVGVIVVLVVFGCVWGSVAAVLNSSGSSSTSSGDTIAVIPLSGTISGTGAGSGAVNPQSFRKLLRRAADDDNVKAVVLRVDSPGGTVAASEEIATYVKNLSKEKPVVVSVGDMDASGAYMVSSQASKIVANPGSAVGSIGVIMEVPNASNLMSKIGVQFKVITAGKYKDAGSPFRALTTTETTMLQSQIDEVYGQFIDIVASGRKLPRSQVESMATGWAWTGEEAKKMGLVDKVGTYEDALGVAADLGDMKPGSYKVDVYDENQLSGILSALMGLESQLQAFGANNPVNPASVSGTALAK